MFKTSSSEEILNWEDEAKAIIRDVTEHVNYIAVSDKLQSTSYEIFLNLRTLEDRDYCIRASGNGFQIVAEVFDKVINRDQNDEEEEEIYETPYALLNKVSPSYVESFANKLTTKLKFLQQSGE